LDGIEEHRSLSSEEILRKEVTTVELETILLEEVSWKQKLRALWLKEEDKNTKFFLQVANSNRKCNTIENLVINGDISFNPDKVKDHIVQFSTQLHSESKIGGQTWMVFLSTLLVRRQFGWSKLLRKWRFQSGERFE
jgi:hypothetical protein